MAYSKAKLKAVGNHKFIKEMSTYTTPPDISCTCNGCEFTSNVIQYFTQGNKQFLNL